MVYLKIIEIGGFVEFWHLILGCFASGAIAGVVAFIRGCAVGWEDCLKYQEAVDLGDIDPQQELMIHGWYSRRRPNRDTDGPKSGPLSDERALGR